MCLTRKLSDEDLLEFNNEFNTNLRIMGGRFDGNGILNKAEYESYHEMIEEFRKSVERWLNDHEFPVRSFIVSRHISLRCNGKLSHDQISAFGDKFNLKCREFNVSCNSDNIEYVFS